MAQKVTNNTKSVILVAAKAIVIVIVCSWSNATDGLIGLGEAGRGPGVMGGGVAGCRLTVSHSVSPSGGDTRN